MKFKHHVSNSDKNEDPLNEKKSRDKALMTGQQKEERICTLQDHLILKKKGKGDHSYEKQVSRTTKEDKNLQKRIISTRRPHFLDKEKCQSRLMTCQNPFKREKDTEERRKTIKNLLRAL